jgi:hypothetical protein
MQCSTGCYSVLQTTRAVLARRGHSKSPESAASFGFIVLFPLAFVSNALVPTEHMPGRAAQRE